MADYERKPDYVEAFIVPDGHAIRITTPDSEEIKAHAGDYIVRFKASNEMRVMSREEFESQFRLQSSGITWYTYPYQGNWNVAGAYNGVVQGNYTLGYGK